VALAGVIVIVIDAETVKETVAVAVLVESAALVAVTVTFWGLLTEAGAVYSPAAEIVPAAGLTDQETPVLVEPVTVAVNC
jgi:hypothetical protein